MGPWCIFMNSLMCTGKECKLWKGKELKQKTPFFMLISTEEAGKLKVVRAFKWILNIHQSTEPSLGWMLHITKKSASKAVSTARWEIQNSCGNSFRVAIQEMSLERNMKLSLTQKFVTSTGDYYTACLFIVFATKVQSLKGEQDNLLQCCRRGNFTTDFIFCLSTEKS